MRWAFIGGSILLAWTGCSGSVIRDDAVAGGGTFSSGGTGKGGNSSNPNRGGNSGSNVPFAGDSGTGATNSSAGSSGATSSAGEGGMGGVPFVEYACLHAEDQAGAPSSYVADADWYCECEGAEYCGTVSTATLCLKGLPCPTTLNDIRHGLACPGAGDGAYIECDNGSGIQWGGSRTLDYSPSAQAAFPRGMLEATFSSDGALKSFQFKTENPDADKCTPADVLVVWDSPNVQYLGDCRQCVIGQGQTCIVDQYGRIALPPLGSGGAGGTSGTGGVGGTSGVGEGGASGGDAEGGA